MASMDEINPSRRELTVGITIITILACIAVTRDGMSQARHTPLRSEVGRALPAGVAIQYSGPSQGSRMPQPELAMATKR
jgi:hypothetical protein